MNEANTMAVEVGDDLTVTVERDGQRIAVRLNAAEARAVAGALAEFAARPRLVVSGAPNLINSGAVS